MFIRKTRVRKKNGVTYCYAQLVESYRRADGKPRQRVIASLGKLSELEVENFKVALQAAKDGESVLRLVESNDRPVVRKNLEYLPIAVILEMSRRTGLRDLLAKLLNGSKTSVAVSAMVEALIAHRMVAPGSKLAAVRWFERTALPQLLGVKVEALNNSRIHRALDALDKVRPRLQLGLAELFQQSTEADQAIFIDVSDTWFEGRGPELAKRAKTKEGHYRKKIGIVLAVNQQGYPVRWEVVSGRQNEGWSIQGMAQQLNRIEWMRKLCVVFDRAMGKPCYLQELSERGPKFLTLLTRECFHRYVEDELEQLRLDELTVDSEEDSQAQATAIEVLKDHGFSPLGRRLWAKDLGVRGRRAKKAGSREQIRRARRLAPSKAQKRAHRAAQAMQLAQELTDFKQSTGVTYAEAARQKGLSRGKANHLRALMKLSPTVQSIVADGRCFASLNRLEKIGALSANAQHDALKPFCFDSSFEPPFDEQSQGPDDADKTGPYLRLILAFDPEVFARCRAQKLAHACEIETEAQRLDVALLEREISAATAERKLAKLLARHSMTDCFDVIARPSGVTLMRNEAIWKRKRRADGIRLFALHPELEITPEQALDLYAAKMAVEVDFHVIKSVTKIRPVHHQTNHKVRAHVDLCILALAMERALNQSLNDTFSAPAALEELTSVHLTEVSPNAGAKPLQVITTPSPAQKELLRKIEMLHLIESLP